MHIDLDISINNKNLMQYGLNTLIRVRSRQTNLLVLTSTPITATQQRQEEGPKKCLFFLSKKCHF